MGRLPHLNAHVAVDLEEAGLTGVLCHLEQNRLCCVQVYKCTEVTCVQVYRGHMCTSVQSVQRSHGVQVYKCTEVTLLKGKGENTGRL